MQCRYRTDVNLAYRNVLLRGGKFSDNAAAHAAVRCPDHIGLTREKNAQQAGYPIDKAGAGRSILQHELAHVIHHAVIGNEYLSVYKEIKKAYKAKKKKGDWKGSYAMTNYNLSKMESIV